MSFPWPPASLDAFARALPFEHLLRKRAPDEAMARWRAEATAFAGAPRCRVGLVLACCPSLEAMQQTIGCWVLQTWRDLALVLVGERPAGLDDWLANALPFPVVRTMAIADEGLEALGVDWVVPGAGGDLLHPSLAGVVARAAASGAEAVAWDWLTARRSGGHVSITARHRGPWRDDAAELSEDLRGRAFALRAADWRAHPVDGAWMARMGIAGRDVRATVHSEPLGIYPESPLRATPSPQLAAALWDAGFVDAGDGLVPARAAKGVSIVILYRDRAELTLRAIDSVRRQEFGGKLQLVLVDNESGAATKRAVADAVAGLPDGIDVALVDYDHPFNHSRQCNLGVAAANEEVVVFLNNDVELLDTTALDRLSRWALVPGVATAGACVVDANGLPVGGGFRARRLPGAEFNSPVEEAAGPLAARVRCTVGNGFACAAVARAVFRDLGGLNEIDFPIGYNDVEFCLRATADGWMHVNVGSARVTHAVGASRGRTDEIAQKLALRCRHPWLSVRALQEFDSEPVALPVAQLPTFSVPRVAAAGGNP